MVTKPRQYVAAPTFTPLPYGLLTSLSTEIRQPSDGHWQGGVIWESLCVDTITLTYDECLVVSGVGAAVSPPPKKTPSASYTMRGAQPFTVYSEVDCSAVGFYGRSEDTVRLAHEMAQSRSVEKALWTGVSAPGAQTVYPHLAATSAYAEGDITLQTAATTVSGVGITKALGALEKALASCYDGVGVIHAPRDLAPAFADAHLLELQGNRYRTPNGNIVVFGAGYPGSGPGGTGTNWIFATGKPFIYMSELTVFPQKSTVDRDTNSVMSIAERTYVIGWDCCHFAAQIG